MPRCGNSHVPKALALNCSAPISVEFANGKHWSQALEQCGMAGVSDATILPTAGATRPAPGNDDPVIETSIPFRLDSLRWSGFHTRVVLALGITWILDGLEVTLAGALSGALKESPTLHFTNFDVGFSNSTYLARAVLGALGFGWLTHP